MSVRVFRGTCAGLSWSTILNKRAGYRATFAGFDPKRVARYGSRDFARLMHNEGIVRNRLKIAAATRNARAFLEVQQEFGNFDAYIWRFVDGKPIQHRRRTLREVSPSTEQSEAMSKDLKRRAFTFVGMTICYAFMQAVGMVNDHVVECFRHKPVARLGR